MFIRSYRWDFPTDFKFKIMGEEGLEPPTDYLEGSCSIQLSYSPVLAPYPIILSLTIAVISTVFSAQVQIDRVYATSPS